MTAILSHRKFVVVETGIYYGSFRVCTRALALGLFLMSSALAIPQGEPSQSASTSRVPSLNGAASRSSSTVIGENDEQPNEPTGREDLNEEYHREAFGPDPGEKGWDQYEVRFAPNDPEDPQNWSRIQRWFLTILSGMLVLNAYVCNLLAIA